jgi:hypothetical protein
VGGLVQGWKGWVKEWVDGWMAEWVVYEAYEVKKRGGEYAVFYFAGKRFFFIFMM